MKKVLIILLSVGMLMSLAGCGSTASGPSKPTVDNTDIEAIEVSLHEEEFEYHGVHVKLPSSIDMNTMYDIGNKMEQIASSSNFQDPATGLISFSASLRTSLVVMAAGLPDDTYLPESAMIQYAQLQDSETENYSHEYERVQVGGTSVLIDTTYQKDSKEWGIRADVILESNVVSLGYSTTYEQYKDIIRQSIETLWVDEEEIPEIERNISPETLQENGLNTKAIEAGGLYVNMPESYIPELADDGTVLWVSPDKDTTLYLKEDLKGLVDLNEEAYLLMLQQMPDFKEITYFDKGILHGMNSAQVYHTFTESDGTDLQACIIAVLPDRYGESATVLYGNSHSDDFKETVEKVVATMRYADGWTTDFLEVDPIPVSESEAQ